VETAYLLAGVPGLYLKIESLLLEPADGIAGPVKESRNNSRFDLTPVRPVHNRFKTFVTVGNDVFPLLDGAIAGKKTLGKQGVSAGDAFAFPVPGCL
jgi:hypothetical protein